MIVTAVNESMGQVIGQLELKQDRFFVRKKLYHEDLLRIRLLQKDELVHRYIPIRWRFRQGSLKDHFTLLSPHLHQKGLTATLLNDLLIHDLDQNRAERGPLLELTASDDLIQLVERHLVSYPVHILLGCVALALLQVVLLVRLLDLVEHLVVGEHLVRQETVLLGGIGEKGPVSGGGRYAIHSVIISTMRYQCR